MGTVRSGRAWGEVELEKGVVDGGSVAGGAPRDDIRSQHRVHPAVKGTRREQAIGKPKAITNPRTLIE
eukprot:6188863-Pleurochrysis_carterae.AAC.1